MGGGSVLQVRSMTCVSLAKTNTYKGKTDQRDKIVKFLTSKGAKDKS